MCDGAGGIDIYVVSAFYKLSMFVILRINTFIFCLMRYFRCAISYKTKCMGEVVTERSSSLPETDVIPILSLFAITVVLLMVFLFLYPGKLPSILINN